MVRIFLATSEFVSPDAQCSTILARNAWCGDARLRRVSRSSALVSSEVGFNSANCRPLGFMHLANHNWTWYVYLFCSRGLEMTIDATLRHTAEDQWLTVEVLRSVDGSFEERYESTATRVR